MKQGTVLVTGLAGTYPIGGVAWDYLQYLIGLVDLGWDAYYLEDTGGWVFDFTEGTFVEDASRNAAYLTETLRALGPGLEKRFCLRSADDTFFGLSREGLAEVLGRATALINVSATCQLREEYLRIPVKVLIDSDPLYTQCGVPRYLDGTADDKERQAIERFRLHDAFFSFGENVGKAGCLVPSEIFDWQPTRQPIVLRLWGPAPPPTRDVFTTVLSWQPVEKGPVVHGVEYGGKNREFERFFDLPRRTSATLEMALGGGRPPRETLIENGWQLRDGYEVSSDVTRYREYVHEGHAEFSVAKNAYVASRSGWFSCRSACYLASGRPVVVQDTGFSEILPCGEGLLAFDDVAGAVAGIEAVRRDWPRHSAAALRVAQQWFDAQRVLGDLMRRALA